MFRAARRTSSSSMPTPPLTETDSVNGSNSRENQSGTLRIEASGDDEEADFDFHLVPLHGSPPVEQPFWRNIAHGTDDRRGVEPMSIRFAAKAETGEGRIIRNTHLQDDVRQALWRKVRQLVPNSEAGFRLPKIIFDELSQGQQTIDVVFDQTPAGQDALHATLASVGEIEAEQTGGSGVRKKWRSFKFVCCTNSLGGEILPFDVHRLPLSRIDPKDLFDALAVVATRVGTLLGIGKVVMTSKQWDVAAMDSGVVRGYIQLSAKSMAAPWEDLAHCLPTSFKWAGTRYSYFYSGRGLDPFERGSGSFGPSSSRQGARGDAGVAGGSGVRTVNEPSVQASANGGRSSRRQGAGGDEQVAGSSSMRVVDDPPVQASANGDSSSGLAAIKRRRTSGGS